MRASHAAPAVAAMLGVAACLNGGDHSRTQTPAPLALNVRLNVLTAAAGIGLPMDLQVPPGDPRLFIAERGGTIRVIDAGGTLLVTPFLDVSSRIKQPFTGEEGLLSFAFDPDYGNNGFVYVHFIDQSLDDFGDIVVERYTLSGTDPNVLDPTPTAIIRVAHHEASFHYGGKVTFGPDGMLYLSTGDAGGGAGLLHHAQDPSSLLGKILRIDVRNLTAGSPPYAIPPDNPVWPVAGRNEVWAIGLRNPFRIAFDFPSEVFYIADVGQNAREEVDAVVANASGLNYGWNIMEGSLCFNGPCPDPGLTPPVYEYTHGEGCAIIGGYVYRGAAIPALNGVYFFSDLCSGFLRGLAFQPGASPAAVEAPNANAGANVAVSFGQDGAGELYVLSGNGVFKIVGLP